jgi:hypothetical protein
MKPQRLTTLEEQISDYVSARGEFAAAGLSPDGASRGDYRYAGVKVLGRLFDIGAAEKLVREIQEGVSRAITLRSDAEKTVREYKAPEW